MADVLVIEGRNWNMDAFDASTNTHGLDDDGHKQKPAGNTFKNFLQIMQDVITAGQKTIQTTSTTSVTIGTGTKNFTTLENRPFVPGQNIKIVSQADTDNNMVGTVTSFDVPTLALVTNITSIGGSGTFTDWQTMLTGEEGPAGPGLADVVDDTTPQLGGNIDVNGNKIVSVTNGDIEIEPDGTGEILLTGDTKAKSPIVTEAGTSKTLAITDRDTYQIFTSGSAIALTIPTNASVAFDIGTEIICEQGGAGVITVGGGGVTKNSKDSLLDSNGQYSVLCMKKTATDTWTIFGDLA